MVGMVITVNMIRKVLTKFIPNFSNKDIQIISPEGIKNTTFSIINHSVLAGYTILA